MSAKLSAPSVSTPTASNREGWIVTLSGLGVNLALGILYTWSVIGKGIPADWNWSETDRSWPYSVACLVFCLIMAPAGKMQDKYGPRIVATLGGVLVGLGMMVASFSTTPMGYILGFGVLAGSGFGFGYASATPPAVKWFPSRKTGLIAGIVVSGFGLASVYAAPLSSWMIAEYGLPNTVFTLGVAFLIVVVGLAQLLKTPPPGYIPPGTPAVTASTGPAMKVDFLPREMLSTPQFYLLWFMYACGSGAGLMIIAKLATIAKVQMGLDLGYVLVAALAVGNGAGRIIAGVASDRFGRKATLFVCFVVQAVSIFLLSRTTVGSTLAQPLLLALASALIGANYGANLSLFPSVAKDYYGLKNFGTNYGVLFTAWGLGGFMLAQVAGKVYDSTQSFNFAYYGSSILLVVAAAATLFLKPPRPRHA